MPRITLETTYSGACRNVDGLRLRLRDTGPLNAPSVFLLNGFGVSLDRCELWAEILSTPNRVDAVAKINAVGQKDEPLALRRRWNGNPHTQTFPRRFGFRTSAIF